MTVQDPEVIPALCHLLEQGFLRHIRKLEITIDDGDTDKSEITIDNGDTDTSRARVGSISAALAVPGAPLQALDTLSLFTPEREDKNGDMVGRKACGSFDFWSRSGATHPRFERIAQF